MSAFWIAWFSIWLFCVCMDLLARESDEDTDNEELSSMRVTLTERRRQILEGGDGGISADIITADRKEKINESLFSRKLEEGDSVRSLRNVIEIAKDRYKATESIRSGESSFSRSWKSTRSSFMAMSRPECSICLEKYENGETICWAKTDECDHIFHQDCITEWLINHDNCPLCRATVLPA